MSILKYLNQYIAIRQINKHYSKKIKALQKLYNNIDKDITRFQLKYKLKCLKGCGACCKSPKVETTILEVIPLAIELYKKNKTNYCLEKAYQSRLKGPCIFYKPDPSCPDKGRCTIYKLRPLICRLFGFSAIKDKYQKNILVSCVYIKKEYAKIYTKLQEDINKGAFVPVKKDFASKLLCIDLSLGVAYYPINQAIAKAIEKIGLDLQFNQYKNTKKI